MELARLKFIYITVVKIGKNTSSRPPLGMNYEYNSVQSFSDSCLLHMTALSNSMLSKYVWRVKDSSIPDVIT